MKIKKSEGKLRKSEENKWKKLRKWRKVEVLVKKCVCIQGYVETSRGFSEENSEEKWKKLRKVKQSEEKVEVLVKTIEERGKKSEKVKKS